MKPLRGLLLLALALTLWAMPSRAEQMSSQERQLLTIEQQIESSKSAQARIAAGIAAANAEHDGIARRLIEVSQKIQAEEASISAGEEDVGKLAAERAGILVRLAEKQDVLSELLAGLQRLDQNPPPALVVEPRDVLAALRGAMMLGTIVPELREDAGRLAQDLARLDQLRAGIKARRQAIGAEIAGLEALRHDLTTLIQRKQELVAAGNAELAGEQARALELAAKAKSLKQLVASLAGERVLAAIAPARDAARDKPRLVFANAKGKLSYPAQGQILKNFGEGGLSGPIQGTAIATRGGAQVVAPADGHVEFAGPFRSYGQVLILNPGGGYHVLLAGMQTITATTGEFLRAGEPVGAMGNGPSSVTLLGDVVQDGRPVLYIEFRNSSEAIDSGPWWIGAMREASG